MKTSRLISIIMLLLARRHTTARELAEMFEVSVRTIYRDIDAINMAGVPIISLQGAGGGISISDTYKFEKRLFTLDDIVSIISGLESMDANIPGTENALALAKVKALIPPLNLAEIERRSASVAIDFSPWYRLPTENNILALTRKAIDERKVLRFFYTDANDIETTREVEPLRLLLKEATWYMQGWCRLRNDGRTFRISRMKTIETTGEIFKPHTYELDRPNNEPPRHEAMMHVKLRIKQKAYTSLLGYCTQEQFTKTDDGRYIADIEMPEGIQGYSYLLSFGDECEVLEPEHVRQDMAALLRKMLRLYSGKS